MSRMTSDTNELIERRLNALRTLLEAQCEYMRSTIVDAILDDTMPTGALENEHRALRTPLKPTTLIFVSL